MQLVVCHTHHPIFELGFEMSIVRLDLVLLDPLKHRVGWFVDHAFSMAHRRSVWGEWWTLAQLSQLMEHAWFINQNTVNLSGFVTLTLAEFVTPKQITHGLVVDSKRNVLKFNTW